MSRRGRTAQTSPYGKTVLWALNASGRHIYEGTVSARVKARRRAADKAARAARRKGRR